VSTGRATVCVCSDSPKKGVRVQAPGGGGVRLVHVCLLHALRGGAVGRRRVVESVFLARRQLLEEPHVLDGDDGLVGEGL